jgi:peptidoglycan/LPS O-acetylase OafA/YrhL
MKQQNSYRADIDGLRAFAVLLVIGFHAFPSRFPGGYVGVDIFFVISGFLITGLLLRELEEKQFSISGFYARRIKRIFPALLTVLAACFAAGWLLLLPREFKSLGLNIFGGAAFSSNFVLLGEAGYFDLSSAQKPLLHLWSLGVEEQFYIVWPMLLFLTFSRRVSVAMLALALFVCSFALNVHALGTAAAFYLPLTRAWELMLGGIMAALASQSEKVDFDRLLVPIRSTLNSIMSANLATIAASPDMRTLLGSVLIVIAVVGLDSSSPFPGWWALPPTFGTALIVSADGSWFNRMILSHPVAVLIGLISYPHLWHWPLLSFAELVYLKPSWVLRDSMILLAVVLAWLTYRWIERPVRRGSLHPLKITSLCLAMLAVGSGGLAAFHWQGFPFRIPPAIQELAKLELHPELQEAGWRTNTCFIDTAEVKVEFASDCLERDHRPLLFLWGDSAAAALYPGLKQLQRSEDFGLAQYTTAGCPPALSFAARGRPHCAESNAFVFSVLSDARPDIVLLYSVWTPEFGNFMPGLVELIAKLKLLKIPRVIIMGPPPAWEGGLPNAAYRYYMSDEFRRMIPLRSNFRVSEDWYKYQQRFRQQILPFGTEYISAWDALCNGDECTTRVGDSASDLTAWDAFHSTLAGSIFMAKAIAPCLFPDRGDRRKLPAAHSVAHSSVCSVKH